MPVRLDHWEIREIEKRVQPCQHQEEFVWRGQSLRLRSNMFKFISFRKLLSTGRGSFFYFLLFVCLGFSLWPCQINFETSLVMALHFGIYHTYIWSAEHEPCKSYFGKLVFNQDNSITTYFCAKVRHTSQGNLWEAQLLKENVWRGNPSYDCAWIADKIR